MSKKIHKAKPEVQTANNGEIGKIFSLSRNINTIVLCVFILLCYWLLTFKNGYMLQWYDEMSFFDSTIFFFRQALYYPGGLLRYAGTWLTQLMYYPLLGSSVLILLWLAVAWLTKKAFRLSASTTPLSLLLPLCMLLSVVQLDDAWISMNSAGYIFSNTLGYLFTISSIYIYRLTKDKAPVGLIVLLLTAACYFIAGFYALLGAVLGAILMIADSIRLKKYTGLLLSILAITFIIVLPNLYYSYFNGTTVDNDYLHLKGLPELLMEDFDAYLWRPFIVASGCLIIMTIINATTNILQSESFMRYVSIPAVCVLAIWSIKSEKKNEQLRATVQMLHHLEHNGWNDMTDIMSRITEPPNMTMRILNNVAVINLGGRGITLDGVEPLNIDSRHSENFTMTALIDVPVNYYEGLFNESYRWAMEHSVQYGKRVFYLKYMVKDALLSGEIDLARRYNNLLLGTMFHCRWAKDMQRYIDDPTLIESSPEFRPILELSRRHRSGK